MSDESPITLTFDIYCDTEFYAHCSQLDILTSAAAQEDLIATMAEWIEGYFVACMCRGTFWAVLAELQTHGGLRGARSATFDGYHYIETRKWVYPVGDLVRTVCERHEQTRSNDARKRSADKS